MTVHQVVVDKPPMNLRLPMTEDDRGCNLELLTAKLYQNCCR